MNLSLTSLCAFFINISMSFDVASPSLIKKFPRLDKFLEDIMSIDSVKFYLESRPKLIDVSVEPKLVIDGIPHPTGVKKT